MKKLFLISVLGLSLCLVRCGGIDCGPESQPELRSAVANISTANEVDALTVASDLRLDLTLEVEYIKLSQNRPVSLPFIQRAYACSYDPPGFTPKTQIKEISLTCDKTIRGFAPGENILTTSARVEPTDHYFSDSHDLTLGRWLYSVNNRSYYGDSLYDISMAFIPEDTNVPAGDYTFTFFMELRGGKTFTRTFDPVTIAAL